MKRKREIATGLLILAIATVFGQTPPPEPTQPAEKTGQEKAAGTEGAKANVILGWSAWDVSGNEKKFRQYATPPKGLFLRRFSFAPSYLDKHDLLLDLKTPGQDDHLLAGSARLFNGTTYLYASDNRNRFFGPDPSVLDRSTRQVTTAGVRQKITQDLALTFRTSTDSQDQNFPAPLDALHQRTRIWTAAAQGSPWKDGFLDLSYTDWRYWDRTDVLPDTNMQRWSAGLSHQIGDFLSVNGSYTRSMIHQPAIGGTDKIESWSAGGDLLLGDSTNILAQFRSDKLEMPTVQNAYDRARLMARGRLVHRFGGGWSGQFGYSRVALERVNASHTFVDVPKLHTFDFQFSGRLSPSVRLTARGSRVTMEDGATMETLDPRALYWRNRWSGEVKLDATGELLSGYLVFGLQDKRNDVRDVRVRNQSLTLGATYQVKPELEVYAESSTELWGAVTSDPESPNLGSFFPNGTTFTLGGNWAINDRMTATGNFSLFNTSNDNPLLLPGGNISGSFFTGSFNYKMPQGYELGLTFAPWKYTDRLYSGWGYNSGLFQLTAKARF